MEASLDLQDAAERLHCATQDLRQELADKPDNQFSADDTGFENLINSPAGYAMLHTLERHGVDSLNISSVEAEEPREIIRDVFSAGHDCLREHGIASPNLDIYEKALENSHSTGRPLEGVVTDMEATMPLAVRQDLELPESFSLEHDVQSFMPGQYLQAMDETRAEAQSLGEDFEAIDYREYDVHLMAYPLKSFGGGVVTRDSHAFVVVTEKDGNPFNSDDRVLVTRGGPDNRGVFGSSESSSESSFEDEQSGTDKGNDGDVYVSNPELSEQDLDKPNVFLLEKTTITGNAEEIKGKIADFREFINEQDINYIPTNIFGEGSNSNTYAGDAYELLTGDEPTNPHHGIFSGQRTPALENDLLDYEETEYSNDFF